MSRKARIRAAAVAAVALAIGLALATGAIHSAFAQFQAETQNTTIPFNGGWIPAPTPGTVTINNTSPYATFTLNWTSAYSATAGTPGNQIASQQLERADGGATTGAASCGAYSNVGASLSKTLATTTSVGGDPAGDWQCFEMVSVGPSSWSTAATWTAQRLFVATGLDEHNVTTANTARNGDQIILTFNQNRGAIGGGAGNGNLDIRFCTNPKILISTTATANCNATPTIGTLTGQTVGTAMTCNTSTTTGNGTTTLTITLGGCSGPGTSAIGAGTSTFTPTGTGLVASGGTNLCSSASAPDCSIATTTDRF